MTHLGDAASALVDGELDAETARHALGHVAGCQCCKAAVDAERALKTRLAGGAAVPALPPGLLESLLNVAVRVELSERVGAAPAACGSLTLAASAPRVGASALGSSSRRPPWRAVQASPRGRADSAGPGRTSRGRPHGTYVAAAGLAASVMVGLGGGSLADSGGAGNAAHSPAGSNAMTSTITSAAAARATASPTPTEVTGSSAPILSIDARAIVRAQSRPALSVVYRRP